MKIMQSTHYFHNSLFGVPCSLFFLILKSASEHPSLIDNIPPFTDIPYYFTEASIILASNFHRMKITVVNGNPDDQNPVFDNYLAEYQKKLSNIGHCVRLITLRDMKLGFCRGCFKCWHTTPGICSINDDIKHIHRDVINADLVIWASPLIKGFVSSLLKKVQERMIPLLHPYVEIVSGEIHHRKRYGHLPDYGVIVEKEGDTDSEELLILQMIQERFALNFRAKLNFFLTTEIPVSDAIHETISNIPAGNVFTGEPELASLPALSLYTSSLN
jgi:multimeric flavodoxin WrbA